MNSTAQATTSPSLERYREVRKVTLIGSVVDFLLGVAKIVIGWIAHSQALIADGVHSLSDLATDFMVIFAAKHAHREADEDHPYGHGRIETVMTVGLGVALLLVAAGITWDAVRRLFNPDLLLHPGPLALVVTVASILSKEFLYHYTMRLARKLRSNLLRANAWHSRSDAISSIVVLVGIVGTMAGLPYLDAIAAVGVALMVAKIAWDLSWSSLRELIDTALDAQEVERIRDKILGVGGVRRVHMLRTRKSGSDALVDVHIQVDPTVSVSEGHRIGEKVRDELIADIEEVADVTVHIDPEDDETCSPCDQLPLREDFLAALQTCWADMEHAKGIGDITLHYLDGKIHVDVTLPLEYVADRQAADRLRRDFQRRADRLPEAGVVKLFFR